MTSAVFAVLSLALSAAAFGTTVLITMPAVARARVQRQAELARDRIVDAMLSQDIAFDNPRAEEALMRCHVLAVHSGDLTLSNAVGTMIGLSRASADLRVEVEVETHRAQILQESVGKATEKGEFLLVAVDRYLISILARYYVRGSALWWMLIPLQWSTWILRSRQIPVATEVSQAMDQPLPGEIARKVLNDAPGDFEDSPWNGHHTALWWQRGHAHVA
ncbi:hypothetical protein BH09ACT8_BH09ACT8_44730 [soil metagenome]